MLSAMIKALSQIAGSEFRHVVIKTLTLSFILSSLLMVLAWYILYQTASFGVSWLQYIVDTAAWLPAMAIAGIMFPSVTLFIITLFLEDIVSSVEKKYYSGLPAPRKQTFTEVAIIGIKFSLITLTLNIIVFPLYLILIFIPPINFFVFLLLNGYLLGREYFELVNVHGI